MPQIPGFPEKALICDSFVGAYSFPSNCPGIRLAILRVEHTGLEPVAFTLPV